MAILEGLGSVQHMIDNDQTVTKLVSPEGGFPAAARLRPLGPLPFRCFSPSVSLGLGWAGRVRAADMATDELLTWRVRFVRARLLQESRSS